MWEAAGRLEAVGSLGERGGMLGVEEGWGDVVRRSGGAEPRPQPSINIFCLHVNAFKHV